MPYNPLKARPRSRGARSRSSEDKNGAIVELPLTAMQEYSLLQILGELSMKIWKRQMEWVMEGSGFISFIVQLDYPTGEREVVPYNSLVAHLRQLGGDANLWMALAGEIETRRRPLHTQLLVAGLE